MTDSRNTAKGDNWLSWECLNEVILYVAHGIVNQTLEDIFNIDYFILKFQCARLLQGV